ncbi:MAG TPA: VCBS repeat-containing protein, partial [Bryobacteraceae bacterium]|nr:VCBS repeat-containing protein [Bryobacteraceae bacterium]
MTCGNWLRFVSVFLALPAIGVLSAQTVSFNLQNQVPTGPKPDSLAIADVTGDGLPEVIVADGGAPTIEVLRGLGKGFFNTFATITTGQNPRVIAVGDFNRDG